jgi:penicillin-binding protein 1A
MMSEQGKITRRAFVRANAAPLPKPDKIRLPGTHGPAPYFLNYVKDELVEKYGAGRVFGGGLHVTTTIDLLQLKARAAIEGAGNPPDPPRRSLRSIRAPGP